MDDLADAGLALVLVAVQAGLAEVLGDEDVGRELAPARGDLGALHLEDDAAVGVRDRARAALVDDGVHRIGAVRGEQALEANAARGLARALLRGRVGLGRHLLLGGSTAAAAAFALAALVVPLVPPFRDDLRCPLRIDPKSVEFAIDSSTRPRSPLATGRTPARSARFQCGPSYLVTVSRLLLPRCPFSGTSIQVPATKLSARSAHQQATPPPSRELGFSSLRHGWAVRVRTAVP